MLERLWVGWLVVVLPLALLTWFRAKEGRLERFLRVLVWGGVSAFAVWLTKGRLIAFCSLGVLLATATVFVLAVRRAGVAHLARVSLAMKIMLRPIVGYGVLIGVSTEVGGRWSGSEFVVWRAGVGGGAAFLLGVALFLWLTRRQARETPGESPQD